MSDQDPKPAAAGAARRAREAVEETAETIGNAAGEAAAAARQTVRAAGRRAGAAADAVREQGGDMLDAVERTMVENPWSSVLIAGAIGFGLAQLLHRR
jgi:ElaB/YqjD/DUF883 family membrane-anchored ribosome-binding protein